ncbi:MAG: tRNA (adenosine(37)-N6)-threonylcarbamoyltransferase complex transferase subunit TsaD, partial [Oscillospiraceae bacterium]|nr:tRNA (adenosine(37)-N6)-threonylcarbamoyltransferase complex transferase subunit TsaD [Oscillospiraceae bacterium]
MRILAIESSCDETAAAVVEDGRQVISSVVATQLAEHALYGGVVPEIASRRHVENIVPVVEQALNEANLTLDDIDAFAVTYAPGLIGALLVGVNFAKGLAMASKKPLIPVHHLRGHIAANYIAHPTLEPPFLCLTVSGGHSSIIKVSDYTTFETLGSTRDDAAGEAFDKAARAMGLSYPGGISIQNISAEGNDKAFKLPKPRVEGSPLDFSFSGLKTFVINLLHNAEQKGTDISIPDLAASFQRTVVDILCDKLFAAADEINEKRIVCAGGVSANKLLRETLEQRCKKSGRELFIPPLSLCGDNAAMIAAQAYYELTSAGGLDAFNNYLPLTACAT